ncbi:uncharacterized protein LOC112563886 [Pomacea canaliculata]|uniref:uncharacterized protein LOC112563886 n=1 Tax=Pomacea canaliculata TaxID=400727 RepID=UPI000D739E99|nr:uncharacterized protein LOC112563886 [Pomacea canaliculata]XP_025094110.1 uncharacterized protein LOC112563886 [Pomacea canaliculata]XP_025094111.1 uncharacterized protein LOC112563886 [Pomacea canaliculata]XP_025094112.1 uncharacterized protein LOC112563886 [Pomacea canaliculata]
MKSQTHALSQGFNLTEESEAFRLCDKDEQKALFECGRLDKLAFAAGLKKSGSMTNIKQEVRGKPQQRVASASAKKSFGKPVDFQELKRQLLMAQRLTAMSHKSSRRRSLHRTASRQSLFSTENSEVYLSARTLTPPSAAEPVKEKPVTVWKGDSQILAIDLNRELTTTVKQRIAGTTIALERVTGMGDNNEPRMYPAHLDEFPSFTEENFATIARIPQKIRISPHLSDVIKSDIKVRMGRPRYHEIREEDLEMWNRGLSLNRAHRNLKVFNWLHSLREDEFDVNPMHQTISDVLPDEDDTTFGEMVLVKAVDEPDIRPLLERIRKNYIK